MIKKENTMNISTLRQRAIPCLNVALSVLLCILAVLLMCSFIALMIVRTVGVGHVIRNTNIVDAIEVADVGINPSQIVEQINELHFTDATLSLYDVEEFIRKEAVTDELNNILDAYAMAFVLGNHDHRITKDDIIAIARRLEPEINEFFGHQLTEGDFDFLDITLDEIIDFNVLSIDGIMQEFDVDLSLPLILLSPALIWGVSLLSVALLAVIFLRKRKDPISASVAVGIPIAIAGLPPLIIGLYIWFNPTISGTISLQIVKLIDYPAQLATQYGIAFTAVGAAIIIAMLVLKRVWGSRAA